MASGGQEELDIIQDSLDSGREIPHSLATDIGLLSAGEMLMRFLEYLPVPVVPPPLYCLALSYCEDPAGAKQVLARMPEEHRVLFEYLMLFLGNQYLPRNPVIRPIDIAYTFAPALLKAPDGHLADMTSTELHQAALFLTLFLH